MTAEGTVGAPTCFLLHMYSSILSFKTIYKLKLFFECGIPMPQDAGTPLLALLQFF
jgi:hypothetical protein